MIEVYEEERRACVHGAKRNQRPGCERILMENREERLLRTGEIQLIHGVE